jgi:hypothetical protein
VGAGAGEASESDVTASKTEHAAEARTSSGRGAARRYSSATAGATADGEQEGDGEEEAEGEEGEDPSGGEEEGPGDEGEGSDSDSLDAMVSGLTRTLRQQQNGATPVPADASRSALRVDTSNRDALESSVGTRSSSAGANGPAAAYSLSRNTASGGTDPRKPLPAALYTPSRHAATLSAGQHSGPGSAEGFERADISSAPEAFDDLMADFEAEQFLTQGSVVQLFRTDTSGALVNVGQGLGATEPPDAGLEATAGRQRTGKAAKAKIQTGAATKKAVRIPKHLQNTPYFEHFKKHSGLTQSHSQPAAAFPTASQEGAAADVKPAQVSSKLPLLARKQQLQQQQSADTKQKQQVTHSSSTSALQIDEDLLAYQAKQGMK